MKLWLGCHVELCADIKSSPMGPIFPFLRKGRFYSSCTTDGESNGKSWYSLSSSYDVDPKWDLFCYHFSKMIPHINVITTIKSYYDSNDNNNKDDVDNKNSYYVDSDDNNDNNNKNNKNLFQNNLV
ncbi:MMP9: Matrix metalloproteinase-9 [Crotalus adamanteus]|uniref:MMP9: Matrix metalloproteinase-9 n=1 Tax=Crotalus adamanteus TaxID=8729 RepID=A0AAW1B4S9_CROAD